MAAAGDVTIAPNGGNVKLHPYIIALVRWCVSCLWSTATVLLHRLMTNPLPPITGGAPKAKPRPAGRDHLHPEPLVECVVLHQPPHHTLDVVFVHGLYGSLGNTWRQGEWRSKYKIEPDRIHLRRPTATPIPCSCSQCSQNKENDDNSKLNKDNKNDINNSLKNNIKDMIDNYNNQEFDDEENYENAFTNIDEKFYKNIKRILPNDDTFITEKFYNNTLINQVEIIDNYETQARFVSDLFKNCDNNNCDQQEANRNDNNDKNKEDGNKKVDDTQCKCDKKCVTGCGCICDDCYSPCWPRDWIKEDYPGARVISINYTSDPHLWRPLWVKENKRLRLHERAEQMMQQLLELGVGSRPVVWVGHSKGGLFIKQIYCEAYEAYLKAHPEFNKTMEKETNSENFNNNESISHNENRNDDEQNRCNNNNNCENVNNIDNETVIGQIPQNENPTEVKVEDMICQDDEPHKSSNTVEDWRRRSRLWSNSAGFMFYSVPHRGSPLADIKTPITQRSVELVEISKDNALVLSLQRRWLRAARRRPPLVRSLVETRRTLMSVLWLRIVSADSADPGIGALCGVSVDHREICKPSSRRCPLYTELAALIATALARRRHSAAV